jgi:mRNA interferase RelE/StbE
MKYRVDLSKTADRQLLKLPDKVYERIMGRILELQDNPMPVGYKKLSAFPGYRLRVGDFRILYTIDLKKRQIVVSDVCHRKDAYKSL